jgi:two-component system, chemotaxis family, sensor kinase CheA
MPRMISVWHPVDSMFITLKRHEREKQDLLEASNRLIEAILKTGSVGLFLLDSKGKIQPRVSSSLAVLFRRQDFVNLTFEKLIAPIVSAKVLTAARAHMARLLDLAAGETAESNPLQDVEVRLPGSDGANDTAHFEFEFSAVEFPNEPRCWMVRVSDITARVQQQRELEDLRVQGRTLNEILRGVLQVGGARFGSFLQRTDASMKAINGVLKKPAREAGAFRSKLVETLDEVDRVRRDAATLKLSGLQTAAREFEDSLQELRSRSTLSGSDFLPLAVKLDALYGQFALLRSLTSQAGPARDAEPPPPEARVTENGTQIIEAPKYFAELEKMAQQAAPAGQRMAPVGSLESTLTTLTDLVAQENQKTVVLECRGLNLVPARYQATIKNVAIQLIRNAVLHGLEAPAERESAGKTAAGTLLLEFKSAPGNGFELLFKDDGRGLDPQKVRDIAIAKGLVTEEEGRGMRDRQAIKLIFKSGFTSINTGPGESKHGSGMSLVRRYVHEAGGKIALASQLGSETRFKITLPALETAAASANDAQVA